jgi:hypothetical protein
VAGRSTRSLDLMNTVLVIFFLSVQSSYRENVETEATEEAFDTVQFFASKNKAWRIKTYATDQDVHVWSLGEQPADLVKIAEANTQKHYGDVLTEGYIIETEGGLKGVRSELKLRGLPNHLEKSTKGFVFWAPEGTKYRTKSKPKE